MGYTVTENGSAYDRGVAAGEIAARLANHDQHFANINGSVNRLADDLSALRLELQRQADAASAERQAVVAVAEALRQAELTRQETLKETRAVRQDTAQRRWSPLMRLAAVIGALAALAGIIAAFLANVHH